MKLALTLPIHQLKYFKKYVDFYIIPGNELATYIDNRWYPESEEVWIDCSSSIDIPIGLTKYPFDKLLLRDTLFDRLYNIALTKDMLVGYYTGGKGLILGLKRMCSLISLNASIRNRTIWTHLKSKDTHYYGFRNLDELRRKPPAYLSTCIPVQAACMGISLKTRERRPKVLYNSDQVSTFTKGQLKLAIENIEALKEAANGS